MFSDNLIWWLHLYYLEYFLLWHITHYHTASLGGVVLPHLKSGVAFISFGTSLVALAEEILKGFLEKLELQFPSALFLNRRKSPSIQISNLNDHMMIPNSWFLPKIESVLHCWRTELPQFSQMVAPRGIELFISLGLLKSLNSLF